MTQTVPIIRKPWERHRTEPPRSDHQVVDRSFGNDTDINKIVARFARTGEMPPDPGRGSFEDVTNLQGDLTEMLGKTADARKAISEMQEKYAAAHKERLENDAKELEELRKYKAEREAMQPTSTE